ncbi:MAG TPA: hypothetical protein VGM88_33725 [Kofleriaceae bacterium]|jgi:hypothetical protein
MRAILAVVAFCAWALVAERPAAGKPMALAITAIDGDPDGVLREQVADALDGGELSVVDSRKVNKAVDRLGIDGELTEKSARKLGKELEVDAIAEAKLDEHGSKKSLHFTLYVHGKEARGFTVTFHSMKSQKLRAALHDKMIEKLAAATPEDEDRKTVVADEPKHKHVADADADAEVSAHAEPAAPHARSANHDAIRVDIGISLAARNLSFNSRAFDQAPKTYTNSPVPGARLEGELFPFAFGNPNGGAAGLGIAGEYDRTLSLTLHTSNEPDVTIPSKQNHWVIGAIYRIAIGHAPTSPTLTIGFGYGRRRFTTNRTGLMTESDLDLPDVAYSIVEPSVKFRMPFGRSIALLAMARGLIVTDAGPIATADSYGAGTVYGAEGALGVDIVLHDRVAIQLKGEFTQIGFTFQGVGEESNDRDMDPTTKDVGGAADRSYGASATFAILY